jgi:hypothetical protein
MGDIETKRFYQRFFGKGLRGRRQRRKKQPFTDKFVQFRQNFVYFVFCVNIFKGGFGLEMVCPVKNVQKIVKQPVGQVYRPAVHVKHYKFIVKRKFMYQQKLPPLFLFPARGFVERAWHLPLNEFARKAG